MATASGSSARGTVLVTGATGFVGGTLAPALVAAGWTVRAAARDPGAARRRHPELDWVALDVADSGSCARALAGCDVAYYLIHALKGGEEGYERREVADAARFADAAGAAGVGRVVYLGGVQPAGEASRHLRGRRGVGEALRAGGRRPPCLELRASMIVGAGSDSFRMLRDLAARLPAMILPAWLEHRTQPIGIDDVIAALVAAADVALPAGGAWYDLPGPETLAARDILLTIAAAQGVEPRTARVPLLTPRLSSWWIRFVTGVDTPLARELVDGLAEDLVARGPYFRDVAPLPPPVPLEEAIRRALAAADPRDRNPAARVWERVVRRIAPPAT